MAARDNIRIYTIGVGADEMRMPGLLGRISGRTTNPSADLDEETLQSIADSTGGRYFRAKDPRALIEIYALIDQLEPVEQEAEIFRPVQSLYFWPLGGSLLVWVLVLSWIFVAACRSRVLAMLEAMTSFHFLRPWWLLALLPLIVLVYKWVRRTRQQSAWSAAISQPC